MTITVVAERSRRATVSRLPLVGAGRVQPSPTPKPLEDAVAAFLSESKRIRRKLPGGGYFHVDRHLPFLCIYRDRAEHLDDGLVKMFQGEAARLVLTQPEHLAGAPSFLLRLVRKLSRQFGRFLIVEVWPERDLVPTIEHDLGLDTLQPVFSIDTPALQGNTSTQERLDWALQRIRLHRRAAVVRHRTVDSVTHSGFTPLLSSKQLKELNCEYLGLAVRPIYAAPEPGGRQLPIALRTLQKGFARALRRTFFHFARTATTYNPSHFLALGPRRVLKAVWEVDEQLAKIDATFDFLLQVTPINIDTSWSRFKRSDYKKAPTFLYRALPVDPALVKRQLYDIGIERVQDPTLDSLFRDKRGELDRKLTMLAELNTREFRYGSFQLYGAPTPDLVKTAKKILRQLPAKRTEGARVKPEDFAKRATSLIAEYRAISPDVTGTATVRDDITGLVVSRGHLLIGRQADLPKTRVDALLAHEIGTHMVTFYNGAAQPFRQLRCGLPGYDELQEGLAVLGEYLVGGLSSSRIRLLAGRVIAADLLVQGAKFCECFEKLVGWRFPPRTAYIIAARIYRGGGLVKDAIYLRGLLHVLDYVRENKSIDALFAGKFAAEHLPLIEEMHLRSILKPSPLHPLHLRRPDARTRLASLAEGRTIYQLLPGNAS